MRNKDPMRPASPAGSHAVHAGGANHAGGASHAGGANHAGGAQDRQGARIDPAGGRQGREVERETGFEPATFSLGS